MRLEDTYAFVSPEALDTLVPIEGSDVTLPLYHHKDRLTIGPEVVPSVSQVIETTYGNLFFNFTTLLYAFGNKLPYQTGQVKLGKIEEMIAPLLTDTPPEGVARTTDRLYVDEYLKFTDAVFYLSGFTQLWVPGASPRSMTRHPDTEKFRNELLTQYKDQLTDPAIIAKIDAALVKFDYENWIKGDSSEGFLISKKSREIVRKKLFLMHGAEVGLEEKVDVELIPRSLSEGWDPAKFPAMNNSLRAGSFNRGAQTMLGGESVKWLLRASSNMRVTQEDCKTTLGIPFTVTDENQVSIVGRFMVNNARGGYMPPTKIDEALAKNLIGKKILLRSPMFCALDLTDYCACCVGESLSKHETGLSIAVADYGSTFLSIYMAAAHAKGLSLAKLNLSSFN